MNKNRIAINRLAAMLLLAASCFLAKPGKLYAGIAQFAPALRKDSVKAYDAVITADAVTAKGFISVHKVNGRFLFELPDSIIGRDLFAVNRVVKSSQDWRNPMMGLCSYGYDWIGQSLFRFRKDTEQKIILEVISTSERSDTSREGVYQALMQNNLLPVHAAFPIKAYGKEKQSVVIDVTDFLNSDNPVLGYMSEIKMLAMPGTFVPDRSFITGVKAFPLNIEVAATRTYNAGTISLSGEYNSSIVLLPKETMEPRAFDDRVGFLAAITTEYKQLDVNGGIRNKANIWRWRVEPKPEDRDKYFKGELVEPAKPVIFYIDPATPEKWVPYLIAGVNDWQAAFEKAGFKNAVIAKRIDPSDTTFDLADARHNVIVYKASAIGNAMGHSLQDPRTGEIIESHIQWYHSVMEILYKWYLTQAGAVDTAAQKPQFSDELMGQLIRFVSSHEVGHALGLRHNWGASSTSPVDSLRSKTWVEAHGHTPSIMDYARFNYVAQPEDGIGSKGIFPRIGDYDQWAIEWGYKLLPPGTDAITEKDILNTRILDKLAISNRFRFGIGDDPSAKYPDNQREDLGDNAMQAGVYGIKNLKIIRRNLLNWMQRPGDSYDRLEDVYKALVAQYEWYIKHVTANVGGVYFTPKTAEQDGPVFYSFSKERQKQAIGFLNTQLFQAPLWLQDSFIYRNTNADFSLIENIQRTTIKKLLDFQVFAKLRSQEIDDAATAYTVTDLLKDLSAALFPDPAAMNADMENNVAANKRFVQNVYVGELIALISFKGLDYFDAVPLIRQEAETLMPVCRKAAAATGDVLFKAHYQTLAYRLEQALAGKTRTVAPAGGTRTMR